jgi:DNA-binding NtrC family response regulator
VLLVDDDAAYLSGCAAILTNDGHDVVTSLDLNEGRRRLAEDDFDALITDVRLGAYDGLHLIALASPSMIKIALSAFPDPVIRRDAVRLIRFGGHLPKGGYDVQTDGRDDQKPASTPTVR